MRKPGRLVGHQAHRAKAWPHHRRILVKVDVTAVGLNVRFMACATRGGIGTVDRRACRRWRVGASPGCRETVQ